MIRLNMNKIRNQASGQVVLMVLLASALVLTLGLSAAKQATIETKIDTDQELLKKAFNAAESGIDYYLGTGNKQYGTDGSFEGSAALTVEDVGNTEILSFGNMTLEGGSEFFWLVNHDETSGDLGNIYYSSSDSTIDICDIELNANYFKIDYFYLEGGEYKVQRGDGVNNVLPVSPTNHCIENFNLKSNPTFSSVLIAVTPVGSHAKIKIVGGTKFPLQGEKISSTGKVDKVNNTVTVLSRYDFPVFLLEAITSEGYVTR